MGNIACMGGRGPRAGAGRRKALGFRGGSEGHRHRHQARLVERRVTTVTLRWWSGRDAGSTSKARRARETPWGWYVLAPPRVDRDAVAVVHPPSNTALSICAVPSRRACAKKTTPRAVHHQTRPKAVRTSPYPLPNRTSLRRTRQAGMVLAVITTYLWFNLDTHDGTTTEDAWWILPVAVLPGAAVGVLMASSVKVLSTTPSLTTIVTLRIENQG
jgi:hypothetical protein